MIWLFLIDCFDHSVDTRIFLLDEISNCLEVLGMGILFSRLNLDFGIEEKRSKAFSSATTILSDEASYLIVVVELGSKSTGCLLSHLMPVTKNISSEWMGHIVSTDPVLNFFHKLFVVHINMLVESFLRIEPLYVVPDIGLGRMRDRDDSFASCHGIPDHVITKLFHTLVFLYSFLSLRKCALAVDDDWFGVITD